MKKLCIVLLSFFFSIILLGQNSSETVTVKNVSGRYVISREISEAQASEKALEEAKREALRKAGISESVWSVFGLITAQDGQKFSEAYSEMSLLYQSGYVTLLSEPKYEVVTDPIDNNRYVVAT